MSFVLTILAFATVAPMSIKGAVIGRPTDVRIRTIDYTADQVVSVPVSRGVVTRITLERGEKIQAAATGIPSKCDIDQNIWCVVADTGANEIWVKPKARARRNNLELKTDRRDYSFQLEVGISTTYRVILRYPEGASHEGQPLPSASQPSAAVPIMKNVNYRVENARMGADIKPKAVFDDGLFTYFRFPGNGELPTIFVIGSDGREARVNFNMSGDDMVVQRLGRKFILRLGKSTVTVTNERFDPQGVAPVEGTTVAGIRRETEEENHAGR